MLVGVWVVSTDDGIDLSVIVVVYVVWSLAMGRVTTLNVLAVNFILQ